MKAYFIGSLYPSERLQEIISNCKPGGIDNAANNFQWSLISGFYHYYEDFKIITQPNVRTYPTYYKKPIFRSSRFINRTGTYDQCLGFLNIPIIKQFDKFYRLTVKLKKIIPKNEPSLIIIYALTSSSLKAINELKKSGWNQFITCLIVPDLPQFMSSSKNPIYRFLKKIDSRIINDQMKSIDCYVLLTKFMTEKIPVGAKPFVVVEGIYHSRELQNDLKKEENKTILYTGTLDRRYGIENLLEAFKGISFNNYRLWICGGGNTEKMIIDSAKKDNRIVYFGSIPHEEVIKLQKRATILVNPRTSFGEYTKFSFPSKTIEYLGSGTPTILFPLPGMPDQYYDYCFYFDEESPIAMRSKIIEVCNKDQEELNTLGMKAKDFVKNTKNAVIQVGKIHNLIHNL